MKYYKEQKNTYDVDTKRLTSCCIVLTASFTSISSRISIFIYWINNQATIKLNPLARIRRQSPAIFRTKSNSLIDKLSIAIYKIRLKTFFPSNRLDWVTSDGARDFQTPASDGRDTTHGAYVRRTF